MTQVTTPASSIVQKTKYDLLVTCTKPGYQSASVMDPSGTDPWVFGNLLFGGVIGLIVDLSTGAQNKYDSPVVATLPRNLPPIVDRGLSVPAS